MDLRPDKCNVVLNTTTDGKNLVLYVNQGNPNAWREGRLGDIVRKRAAKGDKMVVISGKKVVGINMTKEQTRMIEDKLIEST